KEASLKSAATAIDTAGGNRSAEIEKLKSSLGAFAYSGTLASATENFTVLENSLVKLTIANKGGYISEAVLKNFDKFEKGSGQLVELIKNNNAHLSLKLKTADNRTLETKDLYFEPTLTKSGEDQVLTMRLKAGANEYLEYQYVLKPGNYMLDFNVRSQGLSKVLNTATPIDMEWADRKSTRLNSSHVKNSYAVFCLKKKTKRQT